MRKTHAILALIALTCIACKNHIGENPKEKNQDQALIDSTTIDQPVLFAPGIISTGDDESHPTFTSNGDTLYFIKNTPTFNHWTIVFSAFEEGRWTKPEVAPFSGQYSDADIAFGQDGNKIFFISNRPLIEGANPKDNTDIWMIHKNGPTWGEPEPLTEINSPGFEWFPTVTNDGTIYFGSERQEGNYGPKGTSDLWRSKFIDGRYTEPENLGEMINTPGNDIEGYIAPDESFLIFSSNGHKENQGAYDLYISYNREGNWTKPCNLGSAINSEGWEFGAKLSPDGNYLFFASNRNLFSQPLKKRLSYDQLIEKLHGPGNGLRDIYQVSIETICDQCGSTIIKSRDNL
ncbi:hypothetical protein [Galbibacter sp. PAP.153]|uniref:hypothetical protein n=1 Tax=Galbibacter sp. PAP.153 TaxID=3104623 RepID=UPI00300A6BF2